MDRNITFLAKGRGAVNMLTEHGLFSLSHQMVGIDSDLVSRIDSVESRLSNGGVLLDRLNSLENRVQQIADSQSYSSEADDPLTLITQLRTRVQVLESRFRRLRRTLSNDRCSSNPCQNGGTCISTFNGYVCQCPDNWEGPNCATDVNECSRFAGTDLGCQNGAQCQNLPGTYMCHCSNQWFGVHCTQKTDVCQGNR